MKTVKGFSLIETVIFIVIVGIAITSIVVSYTTNVSHSHEPLLRQKAVSLANFYMDEILRKKWNEATPIGGGCVEVTGGSCASGISAISPLGSDGGETRATFDDIDDYHNLSNSPPKDQNDSALADFTGYSVAVNVTTGSTWDPLGNTSRDFPGADVLRIQVDVTVAATSETITLVAYRGNY